MLLIDWELKQAFQALASSAILKLDICTRSGYHGTYPGNLFGYLVNLLLSTGSKVEEWIYKKKEAPPPDVIVRPDRGTDEASPLVERGNRAERNVTTMPYRIRRPVHLDVSLELLIKTEPGALTRR